MGRRQRKRQSSGQSPKSVDLGTEYVDTEGNRLTLRNELTAKSLKKLSEVHAKPAASQDDLWQRQQEQLFERLTISWTVADLPITKQKELIGRYRFADSDTRRWVQRTLRDHLEKLI